MTNAEKLAKKLLNDTKLFAEVLNRGICDAMPACEDCPFRNVVCDSNGMKNYLEREVEEEDNG